MTHRVARWTLLLATIILAAAGQLIFAARPSHFWDGVVLYALAAGCLLLLSRRPPVVPQSVLGPARRPLAVWIRHGSTLAGVMVAFLAVVMLLRPHANYWPIFYLWVAGMVLTLAGALPGRAEGLRGLRTTLREIDAWEAGALAALVLFALVLRAWRVDTIPWTLSGDEGNFGRWAREALDGRMINMFSTGHLSMPSLYAFFQAAWLRLAGDNVFGLRLPWAIVGTLSVLGAYMLVRRLFGQGLALLVAVLLAGYHYHIHYSRLGLNNIADPFFVSWALYFMVMGWQGGRRWPWALSGLLAGLAFFFYTGGRQVAVILLGIIVWAALTEPGFVARSRAGLGAMLLGFVVAAGPMLLFAFQHPDDFNARINQVGIIQSGWLEREAELLGRSQAAVVAEQFRKVLFAFNVFHDRTDFYKPGRPLLDFGAAMLFLLGGVLSVARLVDRRPASSGGEPGPARPAVVELPAWRYATFAIWFLVVIVTGGVLTEGAPSSQRILSSSVPAIFFVALALWELSRIVTDLLRVPVHGRAVLALAVAAVMVFGSVRFYFGPYQDSWTYGSFNGEVSTAIGHHMQSLGPSWKQYFHGAPRMWAEFGSATFISRNPYLDVVEPLSGPPAYVEPGYNAAFILLPERMGDLAFIRQAYPDGTLVEIYRAGGPAGEPDGPLLFTAYDVVIRSSE